MHFNKKSSVGVVCSCYCYCNCWFCFCYCCCFTCICSWSCFVCCCVLLCLLLLLLPVAACCCCCCCSSPNNPGCANFASILRKVLFGAISTQNYYVSTVCVEFARIITLANFAQIRLLRRRMRRNCAKKIVCAKKRMRKKSKKNRSPDSNPGFLIPRPALEPLSHPAIVTYSG